MYMIFDDLRKLLEQMDSEDMDIETYSEVRNIRTDTNDRPKKSAAKRRDTRFDHSRKQNAADVTADNQADEEPVVSIRSRDDSDTVQVTVDAPADATIEAGQLRITVSASEYTSLKEIDIDSPEIANRTVNNGITTIEICPA